jgi:hypothetical protein
MLRPTLAVFLACLEAPAAHTPQLPLKTPNSTYPTATGRVVAVHSGGDLQAALNQAHCGDEVVLDAGASWRGNFTLPNKNCAGSLKGGWVIVRSSAKASLPPRGTRATRSSQPNMAALCTSNSSPVLANITNSTRSARAAGFYWFEGLEITACAGYRSTLFNAVLFSMPGGAGSAPQDGVIAGMPHDIVFSHCYIHGVPNDGGMVRGLFLDGYNYTVMDSTITDWQSRAQDSQGILMDCGTGNLLIENNDIEASANNVLIAAPECALVPADITITHNYLIKLSSWNPRFILKNFVEFKNGQRILVSGNVMAHGFAEAQNGPGVLITPRTSTGSEAAGTWASVAQVSDATITYNVIHDTGLGIVVASVDSNCKPEMHCLSSARTLIRNNLLYNIDLPTAPDWCFQLDAPTDLTIDHNTCVSSNRFSQSLFVDSYPNTNTRLTNNIFNQDIGGQGVAGPAAVALSSRFGNNNGAEIEKNGGYGPAWTSATVREWDACNCAMGTLFSTGNPFVDTTRFAVAEKSPFRRSGTDGKDLGWDAEGVRPDDVVSGVMGKPAHD